MSEARQDPDGTGALVLIEYFQIPFPRQGGMLYNVDLKESNAARVNRQTTVDAGSLDGRNKDLCRVLEQSLCPAEGHLFLRAQRR